MFKKGILGRLASRNGMSRVASMMVRWLKVQAENFGKTPDSQRYCPRKHASSKLSGRQI